MEKVRLGIVGLGWVAQVVHLPILSKLTDAVIVAACDRLRDRARLVSEKYGIKRYYTSLDDLLRHEELSAMIICTPTNAHKECAVASLQAGKDVLLEKPIAPAYAEAEEIAQVVKQTERRLMVGMNHRFRPDTMLLKSFIESKELGEIFYTKIGWLRKRNSDAGWLTQKEKSGGGVLLDLGISILDMAFWMMGFPKVKKVRASHFNHTTRGVEDTSLLSIMMENGSIVNIDVSWSMCMQDDVYYCQIFGTKGTATLSPLKIMKELHGNLVNLAPVKQDPPEKLFRRSYENEIRHFLSAVRGIHPVISTAEEALKRMKIIEAAYRSAKLGREVLLT